MNNMNLISEGEGYYVFDNCIPDIRVPMQVIRDLNHNGQFNYDTENVAGRLSANNIPYFSWLHFTFHYILTDAHNLIRDTKPSYNFLMQYLPGSEMYKHTDRPQCKWNFALQIHGESPFFIEQGENKGFKPIGNIRIEDTDFEDHRVFGEKQEPHRIILKPNMGILYSGTDNAHWLPPEEFYRAACVFHFVDKDFRGNLD